MEIGFSKFFSSLYPRIGPWTSKPIVYLLPTVNTTEYRRYIYLELTVASLATPEAPPALLLSSSPPH